MVVVAIAVIFFGALKLYDFLVAAVNVVKHRNDAVTGKEGHTRVDVDWTPIFARAERLRTRWRQEDREGSLRDRLLSLGVDGLFRAPVLAGLQAAALLYVAGGVRGTTAASGQSCEFAGGQPGAAALLVLAAIVCVMVGAMGIVSLLLVIALAPGEDVEVVAGQYLRRTRRDPGDRRPLGPIVVVPAVTLALFGSFAALYLCLFRADSSAFAVTPCSVDAATMIYFSTSIGATVGFGDITATSDAARLIVSFEVISFVTLLTLFLQTMRLRRESLGPGHEDPQTVETEPVTAQVGAGSQKGQID